MGKFAKKYGLYESAVGRIFKETRLKTLVRPNIKKRVTTPECKKQALERSIQVEMNNADISYFLKLPSYLVTNFYYFYYKGNKKRPKILQQISFGYPTTKKSILNYKFILDFYNNLSHSARNQSNKAIVL